MKTFYVYVLASKNRVLYVGVTNDLSRRVGEHKAGKHGAFTSRYGVNRLVFFETFRDVKSAIRREKELKGFSRAKKVALVEAENPGWVDLAENW